MQHKNAAARFTRRHVFASHPYRFDLHCLLVWIFISLWLVSPALCSGLSARDNTFDKISCKMVVTSFSIAWVENGSSLKCWITIVSLLAPWVFTFYYWPELNFSYPLNFLNTFTYTFFKVDPWAMVEIYRLLHIDKNCYHQIQNGSVRG